MSDRYLFKAKGIESGEWIYGNLLRTDDGMYIIQNHVPQNLLKQYEVDSTTICQYTELTDKNGKKIWENDIVEYRGTMESIGIVKFGRHGEEYGYYIKWVKGDSSLRSDFLYWHKKVECIGNIFDAPELLKGVV